MREGPKEVILVATFISVLKYLISFTATSFKIILLLGEKMLEENFAKV